MKVNYGKSIHGRDEVNEVIKTFKNSTQMGKKTRVFEKTPKCQRSESRQNLEKEI